MIKILLAFIVPLVVAGFAVAPPEPCLTQSEVEKILGQSARLTESSSVTKEGIKKEKCSYLGNSKDPRTNGDVNLSFIREEFPDTASAAFKFQDIIKNNRGMAGQERIPNLGAEAWFHSDGENFCLIMVRQQNQLILMKINKLTPKVSIKNLKEVVGNYVAL